ncbi:MAG TPA: hypothetical protein PLA68_16000, partial [Panacibacter sp.]|nr:hypothetical protein [Panacibacter sp.]
LAPALHNPISGPMSSEDRKLFYGMYIPSIIAKSGMAPAKFDNFGFSFGDDKVNFSTGLVSWGGQNTDNKSIGLQVSAAAPNGSKTLFQPGSKAFDFGLGLKYTLKNEGKVWNVSHPAVGIPPPVISSQSFSWWNLSFNSDYSALNIFDSDTTYNKRKEFTYEFLVNINGVFNSLYFKNLIRRRLTWSAGIGLAKFNNYTNLDEITLHNGNYYSTSGVFSEKDNTTGRMGNYETFTGLIFRGALYKPLTNPYAFSNVYLGLTANYYGIGSSSNILNSNFGVYFSKRHYDDVVDEVVDANANRHIVNTRKLVEDFSIGLIADFKNIQAANQDDYWGKNFKVILSAQIPLKFK